jgi:hypothetical protein
MADALKEAVERLTRALEGDRDSRVVATFWESRPGVRTPRNTTVADLRTILAALASTQTEAGENAETLTKQNDLIRRIGAERDAAEARERVITDAMVKRGGKAVGDELTGQELSGAFDDLGEDGSNEAIARACLEAALLSPQAAPVEQGEATWKPGDTAFHTIVGNKVTLVEPVEGWWQVRCSDGSFCIVRPSHLSANEQKDGAS